MGTFPGLLLIFQAPQNFNLTGAISGAAGRVLAGCSRVALCYTEIMTDRTGRVALVSYANEGINQNRKIIRYEENGSVCNRDAWPGFTCSMQLKTGLAISAFTQDRFP